MGIFTPPPSGETSEQRQTREQQEQQQNDQKGGDELTKQKNKLKNEGESIHNFSKTMAAQIPKSQGGMTANDFENKFVPGFESGYINQTPDTTDTPYDEPYSQRPKVRILSKGDY
jgi:hypothetical protein